MVHVLLLAYNEAAGIRAALERLQEVLSAQSEPFRFVVLDDGSTDATAEIVTGLAGRMPIELVRQPRNMGVARAFDTGLRAIAAAAAPGDAVVTLEGDNTNDPSHALEMLRLLRGGLDVVTASRYVAGGRYVGFPPGRYLFSVGANALMRLFCGVKGIRDYTIFYRAYRAEILQRAIARYGEKFIRVPHFASNVEILLRCAGAGELKGGEVPLVYRYDLKKGTSKMRVARNTLAYGRLVSLWVGEWLASRRREALWALLPLGTAAFLGFWGLSWGLPNRPRLEAVIGDGDTPALRARLAGGWQTMRETLGPASLLSPVGYEHGFDRVASVPAGWTEVPAVLENSVRSFYLRGCNWDEPNILYGVSRLRLYPPRINPGVYWYGGAYLYPLAAWIAAGAAVTPAVLSPAVSFYLEDPAKMAWLYLLGRSFNAAVFVLLVAAVGAAGAVLWGARGGWWSAALCALSPAFVVQAHIMKPHMLAALFVMAGVLFCLRALETEEPLNLVAAGFFFGLTGGAAVNQSVACALVPLAAAFGLRRGWLDLRGAARWVGAAAVAAVAAVLLTNPFFVTEPVMSYRGLRAVSALLDVRADKILGFVLDVMPASVTPPTALLCLAGAALGLWRGGDRGRFAALAFFLLLSASVTFQGLSPISGFRYFAGAGLVPLAAGGAAAALWGSRWTKPVAAAALLFAGAQTFVYARNFALDAAGESTREASGRWITENIPAGDELGMLRTPAPQTTPVFPLSRYALRLLVPEVAAALPGNEAPPWLVLSCPGFDDRPALAKLLPFYELAARFSSWGPERLRPAPGAIEANPLVEIYRRKSAL